MKIPSLRELVAVQKMPSHPDHPFLLLLSLFVFLIIVLAFFFAAQP
jgi:hypothetical protein